MFRHLLSAAAPSPRSTVNSSIQRSLKNSHQTHHMSKAHAACAFFASIMLSSCTPSILGYAVPANVGTSKFQFVMNDMTANLASLQMLWIADNVEMSNMTQYNTLPGRDVAWNHWFETSPHIEADKRMFFVFETAYKNRRYQNLGDHCINYVSFVPEPNGSYVARQILTAEKCFVEVIDETTGREPTSLSRHNIDEATAYPFQTR